MTESTRERALALRLEGHTCASAARILGVTRQRVSMLTMDLDVQPVYLPADLRKRIEECAQGEGLSVVAYLTRIFA